MPDNLRATLDRLVADMRERYSETSTLNWARALWRSDIESDYLAFARTAEYAAEELRRAGAQEVEIVPCPADGRTRMQSWVMPLAWEGGEATLRMLSPHAEVICDRRANPIQCCMWSEPTPPGGVRGPLVVIDDLAKVTEQQKAGLRGAILLTKPRGRGPVKVFASQVGAAAIVSDYLPHAERHPEAVGWSNGWADDGGAWALKASDCRMTGFQIAPPVGQRLRALAARGAVTVEARVGGRVGEGKLPVVTGVIPGESRDEEILLIGHLYEIGAIDNASGCAAMMEAMRLMASMPRPRRRVRVVLTGECYGTYALFTLRRQWLHRTLAAVNVDCVANPESAELPALWSRTSEANPAAIDTLFRAALRATQKMPGAFPAAEEPHMLSDSMMADPAAGAPTVCFMRAPWHWHTDADDWGAFSAKAEMRSAVVTASWARWLAEAGPAEADALATATAAEDPLVALAGRGGPAEAARGKGAGAKSPRKASAEVPDSRRAFFVDRARQRVLWTHRLGATRADELASRLPALDAASLIGKEDGGEEARRIVPVRSFWGAPTFDNIPMDAREGLDDPRWNSPLVAACYWVDGRRNLEQITALVRAEFGKPPGDLIRFFRVLARGGLVELRT